MGFIMDGLDAEAYDRTYTDRELLKRIGRYFRLRLGTVLLVIVLVLMIAALDAVYPALISQTIDSLSTTSDVMQIALVMIGIVLGASAFSWLANLFRQAFSARAVGDVILQLRKDAFGAVLQRDMSFFDEFISGKIVSRVTSDTESFATVITLTINLMSQIVLFFIVAVMLFMRSWQLALLTMIIVPLILGVTLAFRKIARNSTLASQRSTSRVNAAVQELVSGITIAKNFRQEQHMYDSFMSINRQAYAVNRKSVLIFNGVFPILVGVANLGTVMVIFVGGQQVLGHQISAGDWFLFIQSLFLLWFPLTSIASFWSQFQLGLSASERVFALLDAEPRVHQRDNQPVEALLGEIEFRDLLFSYDDRQNVLKQFNLHIKPGEKVAFVGHTGAGKSSIGRLVARFYEFQGGQLLIDGRDIRDFDLGSYRRKLGIVPQIPFLFGGTVAENIRYATPEASMEEVEAVARQIGGGDWLETLPDGLNTEVGESGKALSMGQRQLVALARVLLQDPAIVILDEATASVDPLTEAQIQESLDVLLKNRTAIVIAHRLSTIRDVDRIIVLKQGQIIEEGSHEVLTQQGGHYAELYNTYFRHQSPDYVPGSGFVPAHS